MKMNIRQLVFSALLMALAMIIPLAFGGFLGVYLPPFSATLASHVPSMLAMLISPLSAVMVGLGSAVGFTIKLGPVIGARAAMHAVFGYVGARMIQKGVPFQKVLIYILPLHAASEALIVIPFIGDLYKALYVIGIGTALHHVMDSVIAVVVAKAIKSLLVTMGMDETALDWNRKKQNIAS